MTDNKLTIWLSLLTGALVILVVGLIVGLAALSSDVAQLDEQLTALKYGAAADSAIEQLPPLSGGSMKSGVKSPPDAAAGSTVAAPANFKAQIATSCQRFACREPSAFVWASSSTSSSSGRLVRAESTSNSRSHTPRYWTCRAGRISSPSSNASVSGRPCGST